MLEQIPGLCLPSRRLDRGSPQSVAARD
ncbi:hypothetical protein CEXT_260001, partial [Caerostris extrusa]